MVTAQVVAADAATGTHPATEPEVQRRRSHIADVDQSIAVAVVGGLASWQVVMAVAAAADPAGSPTLVVAHLAVAAAAALSAWRAAKPLTVLVAVWLMMAVDLVVADDAAGLLAFVGFWTASITSATPVLIRRGRVALLLHLGVLVGVAWLVLAVHPAWGWSPVLRFSLTGVALMLMTRVLVTALRGLAVEVEHAVLDADLEIAASAAVELRDQEVREQARLVHDTVVNTLAAIATGSGGFDADLTRERCRLDVEALSALPSEPGPGGSTLRLAGVAAGLDLEVRRRGLDDDQLLTLDRLVPHARARAVIRSVRELMVNVSKHAGVSEVMLEVRRERDALVVVVEDNGVGAGSGADSDEVLAATVRSRADQYGLTVGVDSAPSAGTRVTVSCPLHIETSGSLDPTEQTPADEFASRLEWRGCWIWVSGFVAAGLLSESAHQPGRVGSNYLLLGLIAVLGLACWLGSRATHQLPRWAMPLLVAAVPGAFLMSLLAVDWGRGDLSAWQAVSLTPLLVLLAALVRSTTAIGAAIAAVLGVVVLVVVVEWPGELRTAAALVIGAGLMISLFGGWQTMFDMVRSLVQVTADERARVLASRQASAALHAADAARRRWDEAGLDRAIGILEAIANGQTDPSQPTVQQASADEEDYLRQVLRLDSGSERIGQWCIRALAEARRSGVRLSIRTGGADVADDSTAALLGRVLFDVVSHSATDSAVHVGWFDPGDQPRLVVMGPLDAMDRVMPTAKLPSGWVCHRQVLGGQQLAEILTGEPEEPSDGSSP